jgi:uncharacterized protein
MSDKPYVGMMEYISGLRPKYITPKMNANAFANISIKNLLDLGIEAAIIDIDNTITKNQASDVPDYIQEKLERMQKHFKLCLVSNSSNSRVIQIADSLGIKGITSKYRKPNREPFLLALEYLETQPGKTAVIGDRLLTDIAGGNMLGMYTIKVPAFDINSEPIHINIARGFETALEKFWNE